MNFNKFVLNDYKIFLVYTSGCFISFGVTVGAHRLFAHKTFKANTPLKVLLLCLQSLNLQRSVYTWCRDHRLHHKYTDTNADPHNSRRGFFFAHMGWLLVKPHPDVKTFSRTIDMSDLKADPYVMFQHGNHNFCIILSIVASTLIPWIFLNESLKVSFFYFFLNRYVIILHFTWLVNSAAHFYGSKPYDTRISSTENKLLSFYALGEGFSSQVFSRIKFNKFVYFHRFSQLPREQINSVTVKKNNLMI